MDKEIIKNKLQALLNHYNAGNYEHTLRESEILLKKLPNNIFLINLIGSCYQNLGNLKMAADAFVYIINLDNKNIYFIRIIIFFYIIWQNQEKIKHM